MYSIWPQPCNTLLADYCSRNMSLFSKHVILTQIYHVYCTLCYSNTFNWILYCIYGYMFVTVLIGYCYIIQTSTSGPYSAFSNVRHLQKRTLREQRDWTRFTTMTSVLYSTNWPMTSSSVLYKLTYQKVLCNIACISLPLMNIILYLRDWSQQAYCYASQTHFGSVHKVRWTMKFIQGAFTHNKSGYPSGILIGQLSSITRYFSYATWSNDL